jgi:hypothetical protein
MLTALKKVMEVYAEPFGECTPLAADRKLLNMIQAVQ